MEKLVEILKRNAKRNLKYGILASLLFFILFFILQGLNSNLLNLETRWIAVALLPILLSLFYSGKIKKLNAFGLFEIEVMPSEMDLINLEKKIELTADKESSTLPSDYFYIKHTSFYRKEEQSRLQEIAKLNDFKLYDIRVKVFSYYRGAMDKIEKVVYYLHSSYPNPIVESKDIENNFLLKELAFGEYVLSAKVFMKGEKQPFILQRFITLWESGPKI